MFPVPTPPVSAAPPNVNWPAGIVVARVMLFPSIPLFRAVTVTTAAADVAVTPTGPPSATILDARLAALEVLPPAVLLPTRKLLPVLSPAAVKTSEIAPCVIVSVPAGVPSAVNVFPLWLAAVVGDTPAKLLLKATKSFAQSGAALTSNVNLAGNIPDPTVPPASIDTPQSTGSITLAVGVPPDGPAELSLGSPPLHPALTSTQQTAAVPSRVRASRSILILEFSVEFKLIKIFSGLLFSQSRRGTSRNHWTGCCDAGAARRIN